MEGLTNEQLLAVDAILEYAAVLNAQTASLMVAAAQAKTAEIEAHLWACRRTIQAASKTWREAVLKASE